MDFNEHTAAQAVQDSFANTPDPRLRELLTALTRHLQTFVRETRPSLQEWEQAIQFLTEVGHTCSDTRQEFVLLSDVLGVSMLVETLNQSEGRTE
ncbi:MAG TPA: dioxygenase, partial [Spirillospora sp.]